VSSTPPRTRSLHEVLAEQTAKATGSSAAFNIALLIVVVWALTGPYYGYSDTWQLVINTGTTIVTFLMVFLIQRTQNHDAAATQLKLDELIRAIKGARNQLVDLEALSDEELDALHKEFEKLRRQPGQKPRLRGNHTN